MSGFITEVSDQSFEAEVLESNTPVLVDFWAEWCGPCRELAPTVDKVAEEFDGRLKVVKLSIDDSVAMTDRFRVRSIPTLVLFKNGVEQDRIVGFQQKEAVTEMIARHVG